MQGVEHYENFPVASWLCPPGLRAPIAAIYHFARTADDLADEGDAEPSERLSALRRYRHALRQAQAGQIDPHSPWAGVFGPLQRHMQGHALPPQALHDLLDAFEQDVRYTADHTRYADEAELMAYCARSANPVGRLLLHLYRVNDATALAQSDAICSALQLVNFWQDLRQDLARGRHYLPVQALARHGLNNDDWLAHPPKGDAERRAVALVAELCTQARVLMQAGAPLALRLPGRAGWELRLVVQGGLRVLDHIAAHGHRAWLHRPKLGPSDLPILLWRCTRMRWA